MSSIFEVFIGRNDLFQKEELIKINDIYKMTFDSVKFHETNKFPAAKYSIVGNYYTQKAPLRDNRIQPSPGLKIFGYNAMRF